MALTNHQEVGGGNTTGLRLATKLSRRNTEKIIQTITFFFKYDKCHKLKSGLKLIFMLQPLKVMKNNRYLDF
jgi:hypothetical protein